MWKNLQNFLIKLDEKDGSIIVIITDHIEMWQKKLNKNLLLSIMKKYNNTLEFDDDNELLTRAVDMVNNPASLQKVNITKEDDNDVLILTATKMYEVPVSINLELYKCTQQYFFQVYLKPLLRTMLDLKKSEQCLREQLLKKDKEIIAYKTDGSAPRRLQTAVYDDDAHMMKYASYEQLFGSCTISTEMLDDSIPQNVALVKKEKDEINKENSEEFVPKLEKDSQNSESVENIEIKNEVNSNEPQVTNIKDEPKMESPRKRQKKVLWF